MSYPDKARQRAIQLREEGYSAGAILKVLQQEFPVMDVPCERTIRRWYKEEESQSGNKETATTIVKLKEEHFGQLTDIVNLLLEDDVGKVLTIPGEIDTPETTYTIVSDVSGLIEITHSELIGRIEGNIDCVCQRYSTWHMWDCFATHLKAEYPESEDFYEFLYTRTSELINALRTLAQRKTFKGTCDVCKEWVVT